MKRDTCEFDALIGAQGLAYRLAVRARSRRCIVVDGCTLGAVGLVATVATGTIALSALLWSTQQDLTRLLHF